MTEPGVPHEAINSQASSFVVEICWAFDHFILQGSAILTESLSEYMGARLRHRFLSTNMNTTCMSLVQIAIQELTREQFLGIPLNECRKFRTICKVFWGERFAGIDRERHGRKTEFKHSAIWCAQNGHHSSNSRST